ncbi:hypothetical protein R69919_02454 [Paraburkholderia gardini]|uniref:Uncharacterized protein n=1 Tax=Paraburkholderia gardini TaxID=2823469 RepID=A0ABM8U3G7_9BURK|nr:hypothetical protein R69919_02454 [Paraburkholderia gardini]CAG4898476.1 hypothetical protein R54767_02394 [Paraburkholderia gardini]
MRSKIVEDATTASLHQQAQQLMHAVPVSGIPGAVS